MAQSGAVAEAVRLLDQAAMSGDALAAATLGDWRMAGDLIRRDIAAARTYYGRAADLGLADMAPAHIALLANGAGGAGRQWTEALARLSNLARRDPLARRQKSLIAAMKLDAEGDPLTAPVLEHISQQPRATCFRSFLTPAECRYLVDLAAPQLQPAVVIHPQTGQVLLDPVRRARTASFPFVAEDPVIHAINRRISAATATAYERGEPVQVLCYEPGEEYKLHSDTLPAGHNQRTDTFLVWLSTEYTGGETEFPSAKFRFRGQPGDALHFINVLPDGRPDPMAWHAGLPVTSGRKMLLSKWIRHAPIDLSGPPGRPL